MTTDDPPKAETAAEKAERLASEAAAAASAAAAARTAEVLARGALVAMGRAANGALDAVEKMLFGKLGGAEEAARRESIADPIERLRAEHGLEARKPAPAQTRAEKKQAAMDEAREQLDALKRAQVERGAASTRMDPVTPTLPPPGTEAPTAPSPTPTPAPPPAERKRTL